jgi:hypothetical protein
MIWYTPTDKRDVWYMPADRALYGIHLQTSTVRCTPADIALYDIHPHACNPVRCGSHACQRFVSATCSCATAVLRCTVLTHNNSSCSSHYTEYTHTPADKHCMVCSCRQARCTAHTRRHSAVWHTPADIALYGRHLQTSAMYGSCPQT